MLRFVHKNLTLIICTLLPKVGFECISRLVKGVHLIVDRNLVFTRANRSFGNCIDLEDVFSLLQIHHMQIECLIDDLYAGVVIDANVHSF